MPDTPRALLAMAIVLLAARGAAAGQSTQWVSLETTSSIDQFAGENAVNKPQLIFDISLTVRLSDRWQLYVRPWFREPRSSTWDTEIYQAELRYERPGPIASRFEVGYLASPVGLGMFDTNPATNPTIATHMNYVVPMLPFDTGGPRVNAVAGSYPLGSELTVSASHWDARAAIVNSAPTRGFVLGGKTNPRPTPVFEGGAGVTPMAGLRIGVSVAHGAYLTGEEIVQGAASSRDLTLAGVEGEYAFAYTKISGEWIRDAFSTSSESAIAEAWFIQATQTLTPRWFVAARREGTSAPIRGNGASFAAQPDLSVVEATAGFRLSPEFTLRGGYFGRKLYGRTDWDHQAAASLVWAKRWW